MMHDLLTKLGASSATDIIWLTVGLLGQLMLATVATHAARNSCMACGDAETGVSFVMCFVLAHEYSNKTQQARINADFNFRSMMNCILKKQSFKGRIKKIGFAVAGLQNSFCMERLLAGTSPLEN